MAVTTYVAELTIFSDSSSEGSSYSTDGHSFVAIKNISSSNIQIGLLSPIAPNKSISIGTWGNQTSEHIGIYYNLEALLYSQGYYRNTVSLIMQITASQLTTINNFIINNDTWTIPNNCSVFASNLWNSVNSVWFIGGTPTYLKTQISSRSGSVTGKVIPYDFLVYYGQGSSAPKRSTLW